MQFPYGEPVTWLVGAVSGRDAQGNDLYVFTPQVVNGCGFDPVGSFESTTSRDQVIDQPTLYWPEGAALPAIVDRVIVRGLTYDVDGVPLDYKSPFTGFHPGPMVRLKRVTG